MTVVEMVFAFLVFILPGGGIDAHIHAIGPKAEISEADCKAALVHIFDEFAPVTPLYGECFTRNVSVPVVEPEPDSEPLTRKDGL